MLFVFRFLRPVFVPKTKTHNAVIFAENRRKFIWGNTRIYRHADKRKDLLMRYDDFWIEYGDTLA